MELIMWMYWLLIGFFVYATARERWTRLHIIAKICVAPVGIIFGIADVLFNVVVGSLLYAEFPQERTFSMRLCHHLHDGGVRGELTRLIAAVLNSIYPNHIVYRVQ